MSEVDNIKTLWQCQTVEVNSTNIQALRERGDKLRRSVRCRHAGELMAAALLITLLCFSLWYFPEDLLGIFIHIYVGATTVWIVAATRILERVAPTPASDAFDQHLAYLIVENKRQLFLERKKIRWFQAPLIVGTALILVHALATGYQKPWAVIVVTVAALTSAAVFWLSARAHHARQRRLQGVIDTLTAMRDDMHNRIAADHNNV